MNDSERDVIAMAKAYATAHQGLNTFITDHTASFTTDDLDMYDMLVAAHDRLRNALMDAAKKLSE